MGFPISKQAAFWSFAVVATGLFFQNCSQQYGVGAVSNPSKVSPAANAESVPVVQTPPHSNPSNDPVVAVCDPLQNQGDGLPGLQGELYYVPESVSGEDENGVPIPMKNLTEMNAKGVQVPNTMVFLSQVNSPSRSFSEGFRSTDGELMKNENGEVLFENFSLKMETNLQLGPNDPEGLYQLGIVSDDGAIVEVNTGSGFVKVVDNDGLHAPRLGCGSMIEMRRGVSIPMRITYYQGPRYIISAVMLWRKASSATDNSAQGSCGYTDKESDRWFVVDHPEQTTPRMSNLLAGGWKVIQPHNYQAVSNMNQACQ